jgi:hypothetical protein
MSAAHTPGPWRVTNSDVLLTEGDDGLRLIGIYAGEVVKSPHENMVTGYIDCGGKFVASCNTRSDHEAEANARLIAAAPELLDALESLEKWFDTDAEILAAMSEADRADNARQLAKIRAAIAKAKGGDA